ncbi:hypothetical protein P9112_001326 [Eukaryota sp. TZLM1-RC]
MEQADDDAITVSSESPTPITSSDAVPAPITPGTALNVHILKLSDLRDADKLLKFVNKFILWSRTDRVLRETRGNVEDPAQIALANEVARLREELEPAREGSQPSTNEYFGNITGEPVHEWDLFRQSHEDQPRGLAECVTPEVLKCVKISRCSPSYVFSHGSYLKRRTHNLGLKF